MDLALVHTAGGGPCSGLSVAHGSGAALVSGFLQVAARGQLVVGQASRATAVVAGLGVDTGTVVVTAILPGLGLSVDTSVVEATDRLTSDDIGDRKSVE